MMAHLRHSAALALKQIIFWQRGEPYDVAIDVGARMLVSTA
jgi:hypothetical protein